MKSKHLNTGAFSGYDLSPDSVNNTFRHRNEHTSIHEAKNVTGFPPHYTVSGFDHESWCYPSRQAPSDSSPAMAAPFEVPKLWREAMQCVSINANLYPQQILHKYYDLFAAQAALHPGYIELDVWRSKRATERGVRLVQVRYLDNDPAKIYLMVIFVDAFDPNTQQSVVRLVTNTSIHHVLEEPCANCPLWLKVRTDAGPLADSPYQIIPCCGEWAESVDFDGPISNEEKQVPAVVGRLIEEVKKKNTLLHVTRQEMEEKEREIESKDAQLRLLSANKGHDSWCAEAKVVATPVIERHHQHELTIDGEMLAQYWWVAAILAIFLVVLVLK